MIAHTACTLTQATGKQDIIVVNIHNGYHHGYMYNAYLWLHSDLYL